MEEKDIRLEVAMMFFELGFVWYHPPDMRPWFDPKDTEKKAEPEPKTPKDRRAMGLIDLLLCNPVSETVLCEVKSIDMYDKPQAGHNGSLPFKNGNAISTAQRETLDRWHYKLLGHGFLAIGTIEKKRRLWVIPWDEYVQVEMELFNDNKKSIFVYSPSKRGIEDFFSPFEAIWIGTSGPVHWQFPESHPVHKIKVFPHPEHEWDPISLRF